MPDIVSRQDRSWLRVLWDSALVALFLALVLLPWETWLGTRPTLARMNEPPSWSHPLGFDNLGRDLLARIAAALRGAVLPLWAGVMGGTLAGCVLGWVATLASKRKFVILLDTGMTFVCALPVGIVAFSWAALREEAGLWSVIVSMAPLATALAYMRFRDLVRRDSTLAYWEAHHAAGGSLGDRLFRYGLAGAWRQQLLVLLGFLLRVAIAVESALSYLGFGVVEPQPSLGNILAAHFELYLRGEWRILAIVAGALALAAAFPNAAIASLDSFSGLFPSAKISRRFIERSLPIYRKLSASPKP